MFDKNDYKQSANATLFLGLNLVAWIIIFVVISIALTAVWLGVEKWKQNRLTEITRQTNQYITTQQEMMLTWAMEYEENQVKIAESSNPDVDAALESQNIALCERMRQAAVRIPVEYVPAEVSTIYIGGCK